MTFRKIFDSLKFVTLDPGMSSVINIAVRYRYMSEQILKLIILPRPWAEQYTAHCREKASWAKLEEIREIASAAF